MLVSKTYGMTRPTEKPSHADAKHRYVDRVRRAMVTDPSEMSRGEYIEALEELLPEIESMLEAALEEQG